MIRGSLAARPLPDFRTDPRVLCGPETGDLFFPDRPSADANEQVRRLCRPCPLRAECLAYGLEHEPEWGHYGGLDPQARRQHKKLLELRARMPRRAAA